MTKECRNPNAKTFACGQSVSNFEFVSSFVIRASSFPDLLSHHLFLIGTRVSLLSADQAALTQFD
ncbi:MAG: hypothetical protein Udaeo2_06510 [Candidatus Udaeobacter sp.]|nr:MAG: hypothetical protein Udaeo2_06510 [Candidatus Udaeobacter sp.]